MLDALGDALPLAAAIALSPLAVASVVLMLLSPNARAATLSFLLGFAGAIAAVASIAYLVAVVLPHDADDRSISAPFLLIGLGLVAIVLAVRQWRSRPATEEGGETRVPEVPGWMAKIDGMTPAKAAALGAFIGGLKPKNLLLSIGVGVTLEAADATVGEAAVALGIVVLLVLIGMAEKPGVAEDKRLRWIESGGAYWHMVDLLWIVLFAMLYLMRAA